MSDEEFISRFGRITKAVEEYQEQLKQHYMPDGRMRWEYYGKTLVISQAACSYGGYIVTGVRHYCPVMCMQIDAIGMDVLNAYAGGRENVVQGFVDGYGFFRDRKEAYIIAEAAGQIKETFEDGVLYSECYI